MLRSIRDYRLVLICFLLCAAAACDRFKTSGQGTSSENRHQFFDFREIPEASEISADGSILSAVFPNYSAQTKSCKSTAKGSNRPPRVLGSAQGAFTLAGANQTAYLIEPGSCETDSLGFGEERLAIFSGTQLAKVTRVSATQLLGTYDLDMDGRREFLLAKSQDRDGMFSMNAHLLGLDEQSYRMVENFGRVRYATCGSDEGAITAVKVDYLPEVDVKTGEPVKTMPRFTAEVYRTPCPKEGRPPEWQPVTGGSGK